MSIGTPFGWQAVVAAAHKANALRDDVTPDLALSNAQPKTRRRGRPSFAKRDEPLFEKTAYLIREGHCISVWDAAGAVAREAAGDGSKESKQTRLASGYKRWIREWIRTRYEQGVFRAPLSATQTTAAHRGRPKGAGSFETWDEVLLSEMEERIHPPKYDPPWDRGHAEQMPKCENAWQAAGEAARWVHDKPNRTPGNSEDSTRRRMYRAYKSRIIRVS